MKSLDIIFNNSRYFFFALLFISVNSCDDNELTHEVNNAPIPRITSLLPINASVGDEVTIVGVNFSSEINGNEIKFNQTVVQPISVSDTLIKVIVPELTGNVAGVSIRSNGKISNKRNIMLMRIKTYEDDFNRADQNLVGATVVPNPLGNKWQVVSGRIALKDQKIYSNETSIEAYMLYRDPELIMNVGSGNYYKMTTELNVSSGSFGGIMFNVQNDNKRLYLLRINADLVQMLKTGNNGLGDWANVMMSQNFPGLKSSTNYRVEISSSTVGRILLKIFNPATNELLVEKGFDDPNPYVGGTAGMYYFGLANPFSVQYDNFYIETM